MRKNICKWMIGVMAMAMMITGSGCTTRKSLEERAVSQLEEKYNEAFHVDSYEGTKGSFLSDYQGNVLTVYAEAHPDILFEIELDQDRETFSDDYIIRKACRAFSEEVNMALSELHGMKYVYSEMCYSQDYRLTDADMTLKEYMEADPGNNCMISIYYVPAEEDQSIIDGELAKLAETFPYISGNVTIYFVDEDQLKEMQDHVESVYDNRNSNFMQCYDFQPEVKSSRFVLKKGTLEEMPSVTDLF